jgi:tetratricopeptide (TPR) repeat protein
MRLTITFLLCLLCFFCFAQQNTEFADYAKQFQKGQQNKSNPQDNLPKKDISKHIASIAIPATSAISDLSSALLASAKKNLTQLQVQNLDDVMRELDKDSVIINYAMLLYTSGVKTDASVYLITSVFNRSKNPWFVNNLGVMLKDNGAYEKAIQCFLYANKELKPPSPVVKTNLGWTAAYYGDFEAAKKYFNEALKISPSHDGALEGLCNLAYAEGDFKALMDNLFKRMQLNGAGGGGGGNANQFIPPGMIDDVLDAYDKDPDLKKSDPFDTHLFDNSAPEDNVYNPGGATELIPKLPTITAYFSYDAFGLNENMDEIRDLKKEIIRGRDNDIAALKKEFASLPPWKKEPYINEQGDWIFPYNYEAEYRMFERITIEFNKRDIWLAKKMINEELAFNKTIQAADQLVKMANACNGQTDCACKWSKPNIGVVNSDLSGYFIFWGKLYKQWLSNVNWYIAATSAYIKKVHHPQLNAYLNHKREMVARNYILSKYSTWLDDCLRVGGEVDMLHITKDCANNPPKSFTPDPEVTDPPLKQLKKWPEPCVAFTGDFDPEQSPIGIVMKCDEMTIRVGVKKKLTNNIKASANVKLNFRFGENAELNEVRLYFEGGAKASIGKDIPFGAEVGFKETAFLGYNMQEGKFNCGIEGREVGANVTVKDVDTNKLLEEHLPGGEIKTGAGILWTAETGLKAKLGGKKTDLLKIPTD